MWWNELMLSALCCNSKLYPFTLSQKVCTTYTNLIEQVECLAKDELHMWCFCCCCCCFFFFKACKFRIMQRTMSDGNLWSLRNLHTCKGFVTDWKIVRLRHSSLTSKIHTKNMEILKGHRASCKGKNVFKLSTPVNWCGIVYIPMN